MKIIEVAAAVIYRAGEIFATQRGYGDYKDGWEFPGGKIQAGESPEEALAREILEELDTEIQVGSLIAQIEYDYPEFHLSMACYWARVVRGNLVLKEHEASRWLSVEKVEKIDWLPADRLLIPLLKKNWLPGKKLE